LTPPVVLNAVAKRKNNKKNPKAPSGTAASLAELRRRVSKIEQQLKSSKVSATKTTAAGPRQRRRKIAKTALQIVDSGIDAASMLHPVGAGVKAIKDSIMPAAKALLGTEADSLDSALL
jgi:hypothetical protein